MRPNYYDEMPEQAQPGTRLRLELILNSALLAVGLLIMPAAIYWAGVLLLGPYGDEAAGGGSMGMFYGDYFADLAAGSLRTWALVLGPVLLISALRFLLAGILRREQPKIETRPQAPRRGSGPPPPPPPKPKPPAARPRPKPAQAPGRRVEPRVSWDR